MSWLFPAVVATFVGTVVLAATFTYLYTLDRAAYLRHWSLAWWVQSLRFACLLGSLGAGSRALAATLETGYQLAALASGLLLLAGTYALEGRRSPRAWFWAAGGMVPWVAAHGLTHGDLFWVSLPVFFFLGAIFVWTGVVVLRSRHLEAGGRRFLGLTFILWGLHKADYPFVRPVAFLAPWGYLLGALLEIAAAMGILLVHFQKTRRDLTASEGQYRDLFENASDAIFCYVMEPGGAPGRIIDANPKACHLLGCSREELLTQRCHDFSVPSLWQSQGEARLAELKGRGQATFEWAYRTRNGGEVPVEINAHVFPRGEEQWGVSVVRDITERKAAQETERHLQRVLQALRGIHRLVVRAGGTQELIQGVCDGLVDSRGYAAAWAVVFGEDGAPAPFPPVAAVAERGLGESFGPLQALLRDGRMPPCAEKALGRPGPQVMSKPSTICRDCPLREVFGDASAITVRLEHGDRLWGVLALALSRDFRVDPEEMELVQEVADDIAHALHTLEQRRRRERAEAETRAVQRQLFQAQKLESIGTLAGGIAHDFNNILLAVIGYTELCLQESPAGAPTRGYLEDIRAAGLRAKELVKQILSFSRRDGQERQPVEVRLVVKEVVRMLRAMLPSTIAIRSRIDSAGVVLADPTQLHQVLMNLCTNAYQAMGTGGGELFVELADEVLDRPAADHLGPLPPGRYLRLRVGDSGPGIPAEIRDRIFDPYFTTKGQGEGTGLGLAVVHGIVQACGGAVSLESAPGEGAVFAVRLPAVEAAPAPEADLVAHLPGGDERILFVDDEAALARLGQQILTRLGYRVELSTHGAEALERIRAQPDAYDLVITDLIMPGVTGDALAAEIRRVRSDLPVVLCTGNPTHIADQRLRAVGVGALVTKPFVIRDLAETVRRALEGRA